MGSKGQSTTNQQTSQQQTYAPAGAGYIQNALQQGQAAAQTPFQQPVAPVAGFSQDQLSAFGNVNNAQGMAQPYINQAATDFSPQGAQNFLNPYASNVMAGLQNVFGQQQSQATGQLTQAAGGVGADRIAVGQANLANQQGLAAGQTLSNLYGSAVQQAQSAGYGTAALGSQAQNAALSGAQAQLGTGGLQQQLQQAQMNAPYQQQLAQLAYPFQTAQFNAGITGALAPGLGGTTTGFGNTAGNSTPAAPSIWSQLLGAGVAGAGIYGGFSNGSSPSLGSIGSMPATGPGSPTDAQSNAWFTSGSNPYARGGEVANDNGYDEGGETPEMPFPQLPPGFNDHPINIAPQSVVPNEQLTPIKANVPTLNLNPPQQSQGQGSSGGPSMGDILGTAAKIGAMFAKRGGTIPYADHGFDDGGNTDVVNQDEPYRLAGSAAMDDWRNGVGVSHALAANDAGAAPGNAQPLAYSSPATTPKAFPYAAPAAAESAESGDNTPTHTEVPPPHDPGFAGSPWAALAAAGLGMMAGTSPYAGVNIGQGGLQGLKTLEAQRAAAQKDETVNQAAKRLQMEADQHVDAMTKLSKAQSLTHQMAERKQQIEEMKPVQVGQDDYGRPIMAKRNPKTGEYEIIQHTPPTGVPTAPEAPAAPAAPGASATPPATAVATGEAATPPNATPTEGQGFPETGVFHADAAGKNPPPAGVNADALGGMKPSDANTVRAIAEGRQRFLPLTRNNAYNRYIMDKVHEYDPEVDEGSFSRRSRVQNFFAVGTQGGGGQNIAAMNTFGQHADRLLQLSQALDRGQFKDVNEAKNWMIEHGYALGDVKKIQDTLGAYDVAQKALADEGAKVFAGTNSALADRAAWEGKFSANNPASVTAAKLKEVTKLVEGRLDSLTHQYNEGMRTNHAPAEFIAPKTREVFEKLKAIDPAAPAQAPAPAAGKPKQIIQNGHTYDLQPDGSYK